MNHHKEEWMRQIAIFATGTVSGTEPQLQESHFPKQMAGQMAIRTGGSIAITLAMMDGPLPVGDAIGAGVLLATGSYLLLS